MLWVFRLSEIVEFESTQIAIMFDLLRQPDGHDNGNVMFSGEALSDVACELLL